MAYLISETGAELLSDVKRFCDMTVYGQSAAWDRDGRMPDEVRGMLCEMGYQTLTIPEEYGGLGISGVDVAAILEEIAKADAGLAVTLAGSNLALRAVLAGGTEEQKMEVCERAANGQLGAFCLTEAGAGSDASNMKMRASEMTDGSWMLTGTKQFITNGSTAGFYVVAAVVDGQKEPSLFLVDAGTEGLTPGSQENKLGIRSCDTCEVDLNHCTVPAGALLGGAETLAEPDSGKVTHHGRNAILAALNEGRALMAAMAVGVAQRALDEAVCYGKERQQFGRAITENQAIQFKLADMKIKIEAARQLTAHALQVMDAERDRKSGTGRMSPQALAYMPETEDFAGAAAMAKAFAADTAIEVTGQAMEIFGGYGYMKEFPAEKLLRDARVFQIIEGTGEMQRMVIARELLRTDGGKRG